MSVLRNNMILVKLLITLFIFYYFDTVYSFTNPAELKEYYKANVKQMKDVTSSFCKISKTRWAGTCYDVFKKLREDDMYKYKLFVSYKPFADFNESLQSKCIKQEMFFESSLEEIGGFRGLKQVMVPCFGRPALVKPNVQYYEYKYYYEFMIFAADEDSMYVFKYDRNLLIFYLLERLENVKWNDDSIEVDPDVFNLPPPEIIDGNNSDLLKFLVKADLYAMSTDPRNIINTDKIELHLLIRTTLMKCFEKVNLYVPTLEDEQCKLKFHTNVSHLRLFDPVTNKIILKDVQTYACPTWNTTTMKGSLCKLQYDYKIVAGVTPDSVFILKEIRSPRNTSKSEDQTICENTSHTACRAVAKIHCEIVVMIRNLHPKYIAYII